MIGLFTKHPKDRGMTYLGHLSHALRNSIKLASCSLVLFIHSIFPFVWEEYVSSRLEIKDEQL